MAIGIKTLLDQSYAEKVKQQVNILMEDLSKNSDVKVTVNTSDLSKQLDKATKDIQETLSLYSKLGEVSANKLRFDDNGKLQNFNIQLERTKGVIENIGYSLQKVGNKNLFTADGINVSNKENEYIQKLAEAKVNEQNENDRLIEQENTKLKVIQMQYEQKLKNVQATAEELQNEELFSRINNFKDNLNNTASTGAIGQQQLKNDFQDIVNLENQLITAKKEEQKATSDAVNEQLKESEAIQKSVEQEQMRVAKLGELKATFNQGLFSKSDQDIKSYVESLYGADAKVVSFKRNLDGLGDSIIKVTVNTKNSKNEIEQEKIILDQNTNSVYKNEEAIKANTSRMVGFTDRIKNAFTAVAAFASVTTIFYQSIHEIENGIEFTNSLNKAETNIQMITGMTAQQTRNLTTQYSDLAGQLHETTSSIMDASQEFLRAGNNAQETSDLLKSSTVMSKIAGQSQQESAQSLISIMNAYKMSASDMMGVVDKMVSVDNTSATSTAELSAAINKTASSAQASGVSLSQLISWIGTISSVTRQSAKVKLAF